MNNKTTKIYDAITMIDEDIITGAFNYQLDGANFEKRVKKQKGMFKRFVAVAACLCICFCGVFSGLVYAENDFAYDTMYRISPAIAQKLKPVHESCIDQGIKLEVESAVIEGNEVKMVVSLKDVEGSRIDATTDLFDSYDIRSPFDQVCGCEFQGFNEDTGKATFFLDMSNMNKEPIAGDKITFAVSKILTQKQQVNNVLDMIDLEKAKEVTDTYNPEIYGGGFSDEWLEMYNLTEFGPYDIPVLYPDEENAVEVLPGVFYTGCGFIDSKLHIQMRYTDVLNTDNHGFITLRTKEGDVIQEAASPNFSADNEKDGYVEYIFDVNPNEVNKYKVYGEFETSNGPIEGDWEITFPLKAVE